jgi:hypothetical protein
LGDAQARAGDGWVGVGAWGRDPVEAVPQVVAIHTVSEMAALNELLFYDGSCRVTLGMSTEVCSDTVQNS